MPTCKWTSHLIHGNLKQHYSWGKIEEKRFSDGDSADVRRSDPLCWGAQWTRQIPRCPGQVSSSSSYCDKFCRQRLYLHIWKLYLLFGITQPQDINMKKIFQNIKLTIWKSCRLRLWVARERRLGCTATLWSTTWKWLRWTGWAGRSGQLCPDIIGIMRFHGLWELEENNITGSMDLDFEPISPSRLSSWKEKDSKRCQISLSPCHYSSSETLVGALALVANTPKYLEAEIRGNAKYKESPW